MIVYKVTNMLDEKCYIGQTIKLFEQRKRCHISMSKRDNPSGYLHRALKLYGVDNFKWEVLFEGSTRDELDTKEQYYISLFNSDTYNFGYNLSKGGRGYSGDNKAKTTSDKRCGPRSPEVKERMSLNRKGKCLGDNNPSKRPEVREKMSKSHIGRTNYKGGGPSGNKSSMARTVIITFPDGHEETITGMNQFAKDNGLHRQSLSDIASGKYTYHKGFKCRYLEEKE